MYGQEFLFDPSFSRSEDYGPGFVPNANAPAPADYLRTHWPDLCLITGGALHHCDPETVRRLGLMRPQLRFLAGDRVSEGLRRRCALTGDCVWATEAGDVFQMGTVRVETVAGGTARARGAAPDPGTGGLTGTGGDTTWGAPAGAGQVNPSPGPTLGFRLAADQDRVYVSGDTRLDALPALDATIAILCVGGAADAGGGDDPAPHPPILTDADVAAAARRLSARVVIPIHWDYGGFAGRLDGAGLRRRLAEEMPALSVFVPPYNEWVEVEA